MATATAQRANSLTSGRLPNYAPFTVLAVSVAVMLVVFGLLAASNTTDGYNYTLAIFLGAVLYAVAISVISTLVEGSRQAKDRLVTALVITAFVVALLPLISLIVTVLQNGLNRFDLTYFTYSMRGIVGEGGGAIHAIYGTLIITAITTVISVPIGLLTSIYLVEYGRGALARAITFLVDVMTGIPSIVAGLFAFTVFATVTDDPGIRGGIIGAVALSVLMIPVVVRSSEELLRLVPNELREASYALGVPKWLTIVKVVLPTTIAGITTGVVLAVARVIGETAPLLLTAGFTASLATNAFNGNPMMTLPVYVYTTYANPGTFVDEALNRAWTGALVLILIVMLLNLVARIIAKLFAPKLR